jgi:hypothetical protein
MVQTIARYATPLRTAQAEILRTLIVSSAALALICAGHALPF